MAHPQTDPPQAVRLGPQWRFHGLLGRIAPRLLVGFLLSIAIMVTIGIVAVQRLSVLTNSTTELASRDLPEVFRVSQLRSSLYHQLDLPPGSMRDSGPNGQLAAIMQEQKNLIGAIEPLNGKSLGPLDARLIGSLKSGMQTNVKITRRIRALNAQGQYVKSLNVFVTRQAPLLTKLTSITARLRALEQTEAAAAAAKAQRESQASARLIAVLILLSLPLLLLFAWAFTRSLTRPLSSLLSATQKMAGGDLDAGPSVTSHDEIGQLAVAFDTMRVSLRDTIADLELERRQTQAVIDASGDGVMVVDAAHHIVQMNPAAEYISGWPLVEASGHPWWTVLGCDAAGVPAVIREPDGGSDVCPAADGVHAPQAGEVGQAEMRVHSRTGREYWLAVSSAVVIAGENGTSETRLVLNFHDISDFKAVDRLKSDFVAMVSHELRAPLTTVTGAVEVLGAMNPAEDEASYREVVGILQQQTQRLKQVIEEVLLW